MLAEQRNLTAKTLMNEPVRNRAGDDIGKVEDYMLDLDNGCVEYAVLSFGGVLGMGAKLFAIPWHAMELDKENHCWILDVDKERLDSAPGFDKDHWPNTADETWRRSVSDYWKIGQVGSPGSADHQGMLNDRAASKDDVMRF